MPSFPGGYTSPFPHPKPIPQQDKSSGWASAPNRPAVPITADRRKKDRFSSMLYQVIEQADAEQLQPAMKAPASDLPGAEPSRSSPRTRPPDQRAAISPKKEARQASVDSANVQENDLANMSTSPLAAAERTLQNLLVDLVKPLKGLIGGFQAPEVSSQEDQAKPASQEDNEMTTVSDQSPQRHTLDRKRRRVCQLYHIFTSV